MKCTLGLWWLSLQAALQRARDRSSSSSHSHTPHTSTSSAHSTAPCTRGRISQPTARTARTAALRLLHSALTLTLTPQIISGLNTQTAHSLTSPTHSLTLHPASSIHALLPTPAYLSIKPLSFNAVSVLIYGVLNCIFGPVKRGLKERDRKWMWFYSCCEADSNLLHFVNSYYSLSACLDHILFSCCRKA